MERRIMRSLWIHLLGGVLAVLLSGAALPAQDVRVTMKNGAIFSGLLVKESETHFDLDIGSGRIRLKKTRILKKSIIGGISTPKTDEPKTQPVIETPSRSSSNPRKSGKGTSAGSSPRLSRPWSYPHADPLARGVAVGIKAGNSASSLESAPLPLGTPEHCVASFLRLVGSGHAQTAVERCVNVKRVLQEFFPAHAPALTRYSREKAAQSWARILRMVFSDPKLMAAVRDQGIQVRTVRETGGKSLVEITFPTLNPETQEPEAYLLAVEANRIVDFGNMLWTLKKVCEELSDQLRSAGSWVLVPLLDQTADRIMAVRRGTGGSLAKVVLPRVKDLRAPRPTRAKLPGNVIARPMSNYQFTMPPTWREVEKDRLPRYADVMVRSRTGRAFAMVMVESSGMALTALERAARANLTQVAEKLEVSSRRLVDVAFGDAVRFTAKAVVDGVPLIYHYHLATTEHHAYQVICWTNATDKGRFERLLTDLVDSFEILGPDGVGLQQVNARPAPPVRQPSPAPGPEKKPKAVRSPVPDNTQPVAPSDRTLKKRLLKLLGLEDGKKPKKSSDTGN
jgi:hypothetical protein